LGARKARGGFSWGTKLIPSNAIDHLTNCIHMELDMNPLVAEADIAWAHNFFVLHTIHGMKHSTYHQVDIDSMEYYLYDFVQAVQLSHEVPDIGDWYINVGIEIN
jgi:hypothetical protein